MESGGILNSNVMRKGEMERNRRTQFEPDAAVVEQSCSFILKKHGFDNPQDVWNTYEKMCHV